MEYFYSNAANGVTCLYCALFIQTLIGNRLSIFVSKSCTLWHITLDKEKKVHDKTLLGSVKYCPWFDREF